MNFWRQYARLDLRTKDEVSQLSARRWRFIAFWVMDFWSQFIRKQWKSSRLKEEIPFLSQQVLQIKYKRLILREEYVADMVCFGKIVVEFKALDKLTGREESQVINYLKAAGYKVGVLINFGGRPKLEWKRFVY